MQRIIQLVPQIAGIEGIQHTTGVLILGYIPYRSSESLSSWSKMPRIEP